MSPRKREQNNIAFLRDHEDNGGAKKLLAELDERNRRRDWFEFWLFLSIWMVITTAAGLAIVLNLK